LSIRKPRNMTENYEVYCPSCGTAVAFGPPAYCTKCKAILLPRLIYLVRCFSPIEKIINEYKHLGVIKSNDKLSIAEYIATIRKILSAMNQVVAQIGEVINTKLGASAQIAPREDLENTAHEIIRLVSSMFEMYKYCSSITPPRKMLSYNFETYHNALIDGLIKPALEQTFNIYYLSKDVSANTAKYIKNGAIELKFVYNINRDKLDESIRELNRISQKLGV